MLFFTKGYDQTIEGKLHHVFEQFFEIVFTMIEGRGEIDYKFWALWQKEIGPDKAAVGREFNTKNYDVWASPGEL